MTPRRQLHPGAPEWVVSAGVAVDKLGPWSGAVFMRYIGEYPLLEDNAVRSDGNTVFDAQVGYELARNTRLRLDVFNLFNAKTNDITYYYDVAAARRTGRRRGRHRTFIPSEKRSFRVSLSYAF